jgi:hypothetical protein
MVGGWQERVVSQSREVWEGPRCIDASMKRGVFRCMVKELVGSAEAALGV